MELPKFLLADNSNYPEAIFILHTDYPRFIINLANDDMEWFDGLDGNDEAELANEVAELIEQANAFYDNEIKAYE
jgi:hypothetical protein